jgi:hypothetical protein
LEEVDGFVGIRSNLPERFRSFETDGTAFRGLTL